VKIKPKQSKLPITQEKRRKLHNAPTRTEITGTKRWKKAR